MTSKDITFNNMEAYLEYSRLDRGIIYIFDDINDFSAAGVLTQIDYIISHKDYISKARLVINSTGGAVHAAFAMYDGIQTLQANGVEVEGVVCGQAASAACMILLQACTTRKATTNSRLHMHEVSKWVFDNVKTSKAEEELDELKKITKVIIDVLTARTGHTEKEINDIVYRKEKWFSAKEALDWKLIDAIE